MPQVQRAPLADQAAQLLLDRIRAGEWPLGTKLPGETTLGPQLGVGRSTVREAIRRLAGQGILESRQGAGVFVTSLEVPRSWQDTLHRSDIMTVLDVRLAIETEASALAAARRTPADLRALRKALARRGGAHEIEALVDLDTEFHRRVVVAAHNDLLTELFDGVVPRLRSAMVDMLRLHAQDDAPADQGAHAELVEAISQQQSAGAAQLSRTHLERLRAQFSD